MEPAPPASCPRCRTTPLDDQPLVRHCRRCKGSWIAEETLHEHVAHARGATPGRGLTWRKEGRAALACGICAEPMETLVVHDTKIDRCPRHGVWFDAGELAQVLAAVAVIAPAAVAADPARDSAVPELIEGGVELAVEAADVAAGAGDLAEAGGGVFEVVIGGVGVVAETVVDVIAGIFSALD